MDTKMANSFSVEEIVLISLNFSPGISDEDMDGENGSTVENQIEEDIEVAPNPIDFKCGSHFYEQEKTLRVILEVFITNNDYPFSLNVAMGGVFKFNTVPNEKTLDLLKHVNCPAIIFPYLREVVSDTTKRAGIEPLYLAPMNFVQAYKDAQNNKDN